ncbi:hypothetical protein CN97_02595 [Haematobacter massiliensis]|uniref:Uncharacterized protein n=1 Tax=Haematobacter massiliensis TaxID=195105 RepID=A0A086XXN0_9RHOB|nr:hypothetical protein CN97_02595 [Haematobacter massiliensis]OWJ87602.1 hypothetical protein CDV51_05485 [Haematobacter massiliensis]
MGVLAVVRLLSAPGVRKAVAQAKAPALSRAAQIALAGQEGRPRRINDHDETHDSRRDVGPFRDSEHGTEAQGG